VSESENELSKAAKKALGWSRRQHQAGVGPDGPRQPVMTLTLYARFAAGELVLAS
jgi:hypothetical protein